MKPGRQYFMNTASDFRFQNGKKPWGLLDCEFDPPTYLEELVGHPLTRRKWITTIKSSLYLKFKIARPSRSRKLTNVSPCERDQIGCCIQQFSRLGLVQPVTAGIWPNISTRFARKMKFHAVKPDPALFNLALNELEVEPDEAIVFEDSPNGITAAHNAGIFCVAIPNFISRQLNTSHADLVLNSLADISVEELLDIPNYSS